MFARTDNLGRSSNLRRASSCARKTFLNGRGEGQRDFGGLDDARERERKKEA
jgi:hypothetical protein